MHIKYIKIIDDLDYINVMSTKNREIMFDNKIYITINLAKLDNQTKI